ncbi:M48 family metallopeptidase [Aggregatilinea sp.]|uniref:M48 family metallopeptidase n=1 Tax=Aggregatilinea sp. TaxID=2806333 RepID=UPI002D1FC0B3|nr:M48 family metallopeptidase [Aggregatilinea sp.]
MMRRRGGGVTRLIVGLVIAAISVITYLSSAEFNDVTGEKQYISLTVDQEIALGLQSAPEMINEYGGLYPDEEAQQVVDSIGNRLVTNSVASDTPWPFEFYVLNDRNTLNAFALPGGQVFITAALLNELTTEDQIAGVLAHEIVHVLARHAAQRIAKSDLSNGLVGAVGVAAGDASAAQTAAVIGQLINMQYSRDDETESDTLGICLMVDTEYNPEAMIDVMRVLEAASTGAGQPEFFSTHPSPEHRIERIQEAIQTASQDCPS